ncbi:hypothetical protein [Candidatus Albibeggiatoa sp. nov. NOAA]|nr:hypothetical protein [Thiotrichaceae bacterium]
MDPCQWEDDAEDELSMSPPQQYKNQGRSLMLSKSDNSQQMQHSQR